MPSFPLLRLPQLALVEVLQCLNPFELFILAQCSRRATNIVPLSKSKNLGIIRHTEEKLLIDWKYDFRFEQLTEKSRTDFKCKYIDCSVRFYGGNTLTVFWSNDQNGYEKLLWYLYDLYKCRIRFIRYTLKTNFRRFQEFFNKVVRKQSEIEEFAIGHGANEDLGIKPSHWKNVLDILPAINITEKLAISPRIGESFIHHFEKLPKHLTVEYANWITMEHLLQASACTSIHFYRCNLTKNDLVDFLRRWESGEFPNLEKFVCTVFKFTLSDFIDSNVFVPQNFVRRGAGLFNGVQFRREDGKIGEYCCAFEHRFQFSVQ